MRAARSHPDDLTRALLAGGDLAWTEAWKARWHVLFCPSCRRRFELFRADRAELAGDAQAGAEQLDSSHAWTALEAEMRANIRLGLAAGSLAPDGAPDEGVFRESEAHNPWRLAVVCSALAFVLTVGWWLRTPREAGSETVPMAALKTAGPERPAYGRPARDSAIQLLAPVANVSRMETDFDGSTRSRVIDGETGQVTLQQVYVQ